MARSPLRDSDNAVSAPVFRTVRTLAEVPGAKERGGRALVQLLSVRHGVRFEIVNDERETISGNPATVSGTNEGTGRSHAA